MPENLAALSVLAFSLLLVLIYSASNSGDLKDVAMVWAFWIAAVFFIALVDDDHLMWVIGRSRKSANRPAGQAPKQ